MTEYVDIDAFDEDEKDLGNEDVVEKRPMSMGQLDVAMARLMSNGGAQSTSPIDISGVGVSVRCALCGKGFPCAVELGEHMAICTGFDDGIRDGTILRLEEKAVKTAAFSTTQFCEGSDVRENNGLSEVDFEDYDDYDVDASQEVAEYVFQEVSGFPTQDEIEEMNGDKWDGEGLFHANIDEDVKLTAKQEKYLNCYQTLYDDEQINMELLLEVLHYIIKSSHVEGAILVFLPGWQEISEVSMLLENTVPFNNRSKFLVLPLHSGIPSQDQRKVLRRPPPGCRKIVLRYV